MADHRDLHGDELAAFALEALNRDELARVAAHVNNCAQCGPLVDQYREVLGLLPHALPLQIPPVEAKSALLTRARAERGAVRSAAVTNVTPLREAPSQPGPSRETTARRGGRLADVLRALGGAAAAAAISGLLFWNVQLQQQLSRLQHQSDIEWLARLPDGRIIPLAGTGAPTASARLFVGSNGERAQLAVDGLPPLAQDRVYQLWFARPGQPTITGGTFVVHAGQDLAAVTIPAPLDQVSAIAVTEEPMPGSPGPTGQHLLDGRP